MAKSTRKSNRTRTSKRQYLLALLVPVLLNAGASAQTITPTGDVRMSPGSGPPPWISTTDALYVGDNAVGTLTIEGGAHVQNTIGYISNHAGGNDSWVNVDGAGSTWTNSGNVRVGVASTGTLRITDGGHVSSVSGYIGDVTGGRGTVTIDGVDSQWTNSSIIYVGNTGNGEMHITAGGKVTSTNGNIGTNINSHGTVTVDGPNSTWANSATLDVGQSGWGELHITDGGKVSNTNGYIGNNNNSHGTVTVDGANSTWTNTGTLDVGNNGNGELHITNGGLVTNTISHIAYAAGRTGVVTVDGIDSTWTSTGILSVGYSGNGELAITDGGTVNSTSGYVGFMGSSHGTASVDGEDSLWHMTGELGVARYGNNSDLSITGGGKVESVGGFIGYADDVTGSTIVDGTGSAWLNTGSLRVGESGHGELSITNGGHVTSANSFIGNLAGSTGTVVVDGAGGNSTWDDAGVITISHLGHGYLSIINGGKVSSAGGIIADEAGTIAIVTVDGSDSAWTNTGQLAVGNKGDGELSITNGGSVSSTMSAIGRFADSTGTVTVDGTGGVATWDNTGDLTVGENGTGELTILSGGRVTNDRGLIANGAGASGKITVDGMGAVWISEAEIAVGRAGIGELNILGGGKVSNTVGYVGYDADSTGTVMVDGAGNGGAGATWNNEFLLCVGHLGSAEVTIRNAAVVTAGDGTIIANEGGSGILNIGGAASEAPTAPGILDTPVVKFGDGTGKLVFNHTDNTGNYTFESVMTGGAAATSTVDVYSGFIVMTGVGSDYEAPTTLHGGTSFAAGAVGVFSRNASYDIRNAATMDLRGRSQNTGSITNAGLINMGSGTTPGTILTVYGDYVGDGGTIVINTKLGNDASPTDRLMIDGGNASGNTFLQIVNAAGTGAQTKGNGIMVVGATNGATTDTDAFRLAGIVKAGAFMYGLHRGGVGLDADDENWYLRSEGGTRIEIPPDVAVLTLASQLGRLMSGTFFTRTGNYYGTGLVHDHEHERGSLADTGPDTQPANDSQYIDMFWARAFGEFGKGGGGGGKGDFGFGKNGPEYSYTYGGAQIGCDLYRAERDTLGLYLDGAMLQSRIKDADGNRAGRVNMEALSLGGYWTHYHPDGWYTDLVLQGDLYTSIRSRSESGETFSTRGFSMTASIEAGYSFQFGNDNDDNKWNMIPQGQFIYQYTNINGGNDSYGKIDYHATHAFYGRLGDRITKTWASTGFTAWLEGNLWHQFNTTAKTTISALDGSNPTTISSKLGNTWAQVVVGASVPLTRKRDVFLFGTADYNVGLDKSSHSFGGQVGLQVDF